jgi:hypothetical protein
MSTPTGEDASPSTREDRCMLSPRTFLLLAVLIAIAGCGSGSPSGGSSASRGATATATPRVLTEREYKSLVAAGARTVRKSVREVRGAGSRSGLRSRLETASKRLDEAATDLKTADAPASAASTQTDAGSAFEGLSKAFTSASEKVGSGALCTGPAVAAYLTGSDAASRLRSVAGGLKRQPTPSLQLESGSVLSRKGGSGIGELTISNGNPSEGVVKIVSSDKRMSVYIGRKATATIKGIPDGNFDVYFASGSSWDGKRNTFSRNCGFTRFDDRMKFTSGGGQYTTYRITLNAVADGTASTSSIDPDDFPRG